MISSNVSAYMQQSTWSSPGAYAAQLKGLPADPALLAAAFANLLTHTAFAAETGVAVPPAARDDKRIRRVSDLIALLHGRDPASLSCPRDRAHRAFVVCRHFALLATSKLRLEGVPARVRVGFAGYFTPDFHEDHWICEYWVRDQWKLLDAELDPATRDRLSIPFHSDNVPRTVFMTAGEAWQAVRSGKLAAEQLGVSALGIEGLWFVAASLLRDLAALTMDEMLPWDYWGSAKELGPGSTVAPGELEGFDRLASLLTPAPDSLELATVIQRSFPSVRVTPSVLSYPEGRPVEELLSLAHCDIP